MAIAQHNVRYLPIADIPSCTAQVRFRGKADMTISRILSRNRQWRIFPKPSRKITALLQSRPEWSLQAEFDHWIEAIDRALSENTFFVM
jgi:hypothetical protein